MDPKNKVALVTGGGRGIGAATCVALARAGARVAVNYFSNRETAYAVVQNCRDAGVEAVALQGDVGQVEDCRRLVGETDHALGGLDILINNAGMVMMGGVDDIDEAEWDTVVNASLKGTFFLTQAALPLLRKSGQGRVVNLGSLAGKCGSAPPHYAAAKAGVMGLTMSLALALAKDGITVNSIYPGIIATEFGGRTPEELRRVGAGKDVVPLGRAGEPEEVAETILHLVRSDYITGEHVNFTGGRYMAL